MILLKKIAELALNNNHSLTQTYFLTRLKMLGTKVYAMGVIVIIISCNLLRIGAT